MERLALLARARARGRSALWDELDDRLGVPRLRVDALVGQGAGAFAAAVRRRRSLRACWRRLAVGPRSATARQRAGSKSATLEHVPGAGSSMAHAIPAQPIAVLLAGHSIEDLKLAPFHSWRPKGGARRSRPSVAHGDAGRELCRGRPDLSRDHHTAIVDVTDGASRGGGIQWWKDLTGRGGEGMVVKPLDVRRAGHSAASLQPAVKCRGPEYLRIIYGPEYTAPENLERLRSRGLGAKRRWPSRVRPRH